MSNVIPEKYLDLFQKPAFASLGTLMPDGRPQVTPVWCDFDGQHVIFNSARGRQKDRNVRRDPRVALAIVDPDNPYRYMEIRGTVVEITEDGAAQNIDKLVKKYYVDEMESQYRQLYSTWDAFPAAETPKPDELPLEDQLKGVLLDMLRYKLAHREGLAIR